MYARYNIWDCVVCKKAIVTREEVKGVTPFMIGCPYCGNTAYSRFYDKRIEVGVNLGILKVTHIWRKPNEKELSDPDMKYHYDNGGLVMEKV